MFSELKIRRAVFIGGIFENVTPVKCFHFQLPPPSNTPGAYKIRNTVFIHPRGIQILILIAPPCDG